jgi:Nucleotidyl transferase AbiEii toxin, Type IV TA system
MARSTSLLTRGRPQFPGVLPNRALRLWTTISRQSLLSTFYLAGGSGMALHLGHRQSDDLDLFSRRAFRPELLAKRLTILDVPKDLQLGEGSVECWVAGFKVQFLYYPYRLVRQLQKTRFGMLADPLDIALMKLIAIGQRGSKRDFIDLACFLKRSPNTSLGELIELLRRKYGHLNRAHLLRALTYFVDAESEPMPRMLWPLKWSETKKQLEKNVRDFIL